jgi:hypothetical protein
MQQTILEMRSKLQKQSVQFTADTAVQVLPSSSLTSEARNFCNWKLRQSEAYKPTV